MALSARVWAAHVMEVREGDEARCDVAILTSIIRSYDARLIELSGADQPLHDQSGRLVSESSIDFLREQKAEMVRTYARRVAGIPRESVFDP